MKRAFTCLRGISVAAIILLLLRCSGNDDSAGRREVSEKQTLALLAALPREVTHPATNPTSPEKVELGRLLFFDPILSGNKDVSCATCHQPEFNYAEFLETSIG